RTESTRARRSAGPNTADARRSRNTFALKGEKNAEELGSSFSVSVARSLKWEEKLADGVVQNADFARRTGREKVGTRPSQVPEKRCIFRGPVRARYRSRSASEGGANEAIEIRCGRTGGARDEHRGIVEIAAEPYARRHGRPCRAWRAARRCHARQPAGRSACRC